MALHRGQSAITISSEQESPAVDRDAESLAALLRPASIAIIGASTDPNKIGGRPIAYLSRFGYQGRVYPINPNRVEIQGLNAYPDVAALPEIPDLVIVATPGRLAVEAVASCAGLGVPGAIVMTSGFAETGEPTAVAAEREMVATARTARMRLVGPNSQGLANFGTGAIASFSTMFLEVAPADGPVAIISQSGMMSVAPYGLLRGRGIGVRHAHATGNDADVGMAELAFAVLQDPKVRLLLLYLEGVRDAEMLARVAEEARNRDVPIVALKAGRTARGQAAAASHTGALANEDRVVEAFFRTHGIWRAHDVHDLVAAAELFLKGWRPKNRQLVVMSNSGASCVMAADSAHDVDLELVPLEAATIAALKADLPPFATVTNPIDITAALLTNSELFGRILSILGGDERVELLLVALPVAGVGYDVGAYARAAGEFAAATGKAIAVAALQDNVAKRFREAGVPTFASQTEAMAALAQLAHQSERMRRSRGRRLKHVGPGRAGRGSTLLSEAESLAVLGALGLPTVAHRLCRTAAEAREAFHAIDAGAGVVVKGCAREAPHKSEHGLVMLNVTSDIEVQTAFAQIQARLAGLGIDGSVVVARMAPGRREFMLGARLDPSFGPVLIVGDGGRYVEALHDVAVLLPPVDANDVRDALATLRIAPLLDGVRGEPPLDIQALCDLVVKLGDVMTTNRFGIAAIDLNPVMVGALGEGVVIADALIEQWADAAPSDR